MGIQSLFDTVCDIETLTRTSDGLGGSTEAWAAKASSVPCRARTIQVQWRTTEGRDESLYTHKFWLGPDASVDERSDRIRHGGKVYEIVAVIPARGRSGVDHFQVQCREVR